MFKYYVYKLLWGVRLISPEKYAEKRLKYGYKNTKDYQVIARSPLFDSTWYLEKNPDVKAAGVDPILHYLTKGWKEGRNPSSLFDGNAYLRNYPDVEQAELNPLVHFVEHGNKEGRIGTPLLETASVVVPGAPVRITKDVFFSIIVASYNYQDYIRETLDSLLNQTYKNFEVIVVDDGSSDDSVKIIREYEEKNRCVHLYQHPNGENKGLAETVLLGLSKAKGEYIAFCESDDMWHFTHLQAINQFINNNPTANIIVNDVETFGDVNCCANMQREIEHRKKAYLKYKGMIPASDFTRSNYIVTFSACCVNKVLLQSCDFLGVNKKTALDWWLWRQICWHNRIYYLNRKLTFWRLHSDSYTNRQALLDRQLHMQFMEDLDKIIARRSYYSILQENRTFQDLKSYQKILTRASKSKLLSEIKQKGINNLKILYISTTSQVASPIQDPSSRYRCYHPAEVLNKHNFVAVVSWSQFMKHPCLDYDIYIFHRPNHAEVPLINQLKELNKILIADYDDLIFGTPDQAAECSIYKNGHASLEQVQNLFAANQRALFCFDYFTVSTQNLAKELKRLHSKALVQVVHNFIPDSILSLADKWNLRKHEKNPNLIMYCSGTMSHNKDFLVVQDVFIKGLEKNPKLRLYIFGCLESSEKLLKHPQIYFHNATSYWNLFEHMAQAAYTIAPLEDSCFNDCKSNVKFLESATAGATLLATPIEDMQRMKENAAIHLLQTPEDWQNCLSHIGTDNLSKNIETNYHCLVEHCAKKTFMQEFINLFKQMED